MICQRIELENFRNLASVTAEFSDGMNVLWGRNAQGKSNLLESIYYFARGKSFRGARDRELVRFGSDASLIRMSCLPDDSQRALVMEAAIPAAGKRRLSVDGVCVTPREMIGRFRAVLFCPAHLTLISGAPALRRAYLDIAVSQLMPAYILALARYTKYLTERNALLKAADGGRTVSAAEWETYAEGMAEYGSQIAGYRANYAALAEQAVREVFEDMTSGQERPSLQYDSHALEEGPPAAGRISLKGSLPVGKDRLYRLLTEDIDRDIRAGTTLHGVHKDDLLIRLNGQESRLFASQGQQRSLALAMKLAEGRISRDVTGEHPVFLLDDVLSELDAQRRSYVLRSLTGRQIIVTSCEPALFEENLSDLRLWQVDSGLLTELSR